MTTERPGGDVQAGSRLTPKRVPEFVQWNDPPGASAPRRRACHRCGERLRCLSSEVQVSRPGHPCGCYYIESLSYMSTMIDKNTANTPHLVNPDGVNNDNNDNKNNVQLDKRLMNIL